MYVGCRDCGRPLSELKRNYDRPVNIKSGWNNTISVCKKCQTKWLKKHPEFIKRK